jgi:Protein of unknown function (DUF3309)
MNTGTSLAEVVFFHGHHWGYPSAGLALVVLIVVVVLLANRDGA